MADLTPQVAPARRRRSPWLVLLIVLGSIMSLYLALVLTGAIGWDGY